MTGDCGFEANKIRIFGSSLSYKREEGKKAAAAEKVRQGMKFASSEEKNLKISKGRFNILLILLHGLTRNSLSSTYQLSSLGCTKTHSNCWESTNQRGVFNSMLDGLLRVLN